MLPRNCFLTWNIRNSNRHRGFRARKSGHTQRLRANAPAHASNDRELGAGGEGATGRSNAPRYVAGSGYGGTD